MEGWRETMHEDERNPRVDVERRKRRNSWASWTADSNPSARGTGTTAQVILRTGGSRPFHRPETASSSWRPPRTSRTTGTFLDPRRSFDVATIVRSSRSPPFDPMLALPLRPSIRRERTVSASSLRVRRQRRSPHRPSHRDVATVVPWTSHDPNIRSVAFVL